MSTLTTANSSFSINVPDVFPTPQPITGYAVDDAFDSAEVKPSETLMGVDGNLSGGYVAYPTSLTFVLQADSASIETMDQLLAAMDAAQETYEISASIDAPSLGKTYQFTKGFLTSSKKMPQAKKLFGPQRYEIMFQVCQPAPI